MSKKSNKEWVEEEEEYEVESICGRRIVNDKVEYLTKWKDFSQDDNSWELKTSLIALNFKHLIEEFEHKLENCDKNQINLLDLHINGKEPEESLDESKPIEIKSEESKDEIKIIAIKSEESREQNIIKALIKETKEKAKELKKEFKESKKLAQKPIIRGRGRPPKKRRNELEVNGNKRLKTIEKRVISDSDDDFNDKLEEPKTGFSRNLKPDYISGATRRAEELMFLIKWKDSDCADLVPAKEANLKCPQIVIKYYEKQLKFI